MFGGFGDMLQQASRLREEMNRIHLQLAGKRLEVTSGGGMVKVTITGKQEIISIEIEPGLMARGDRAMLQDLVAAGVNEAIRASQNMVKEEMGKLTASLGPLASLLKGFGG